MEYDKPYIYENHRFHNTAEKYFSNSATGQLYQYNFDTPSPPPVHSQWHFQQNKSYLDNGEAKNIGTNQLINGRLHMQSNSQIFPQQIHAEANNFNANNFNANNFNANISQSAEDIGQRFYAQRYTPPYTRTLVQQQQGRYLQGQHLQQFDPLAEPKYFQKDYYYAQYRDYTRKELEVNQNSQQQQKSRRSMNLRQQYYEKYNKPYQQKYFGNQIQNRFACDYPPTDQQEHHFPSDIRMDGLRGPKKYFQKN